MKVVILAGGRGTRLSEYTKKIPKPMVKIKNVPIIMHIMKNYSNYGYKDFIIAAGFKANLLKKFFKNKKYDWKVKVVNTGLDTMTGGRIRKLKKLLNDKKFFLTYGDGVSNINLKKLLKFHNRQKGVATLTAVRPPARFGAIKVKNKKVTVFREKSALDVGWINGGFFVFEPEIFKYLKSEKSVLEEYPLTRIGKKKKLMAYKHKGYWYCMDTIRDKEIIEKNVKIKF